jgi:hypothetical protein
MAAKMRRRKRRKKKRPQLAKWMSWRSGIQTTTLTRAWWSRTGWSWAMMEDGQGDVHSVRPSL